MTDEHEHELPDRDDPTVAAALARTRADLAAYADRTPPMPAGLLADVDRALADARNEAEPGTDAPRRGRRAVLLLAAAAAVLAVVAVVALTTLRPTAAPAPTAAPPPSPTVPVLVGGDGPSALRAGLGRSDYGPLADPGRLAGCLGAHGLPAGIRPVGARQVEVDGRPGVLLVLPTGVAARFRLLVVGPGCAAGAPLTLSDMLVGR